MRTSTLAHPPRSYFILFRFPATRTTDPTSPFTSFLPDYVLSMSKHQELRIHDQVYSKSCYYLALGKHVFYATGLSRSILYQSSVLYLARRWSRIVAG